MATVVSGGGMSMAPRPSRSPMVRGVCRGSVSSRRPAATAVCCWRRGPFAEGRQQALDGYRAPREPPAVVGLWRDPPGRGLVADRAGLRGSRRAAPRGERPACGGGLRDGGGGARRSVGLARGRGARPAGWRRRSRGGCCGPARTRSRPKSGRPGLLAAALAAGAAPAGGAADAPAGGWPGTRCADRAGARSANGAKKRRCPKAPPSLGRKRPRMQRGGEPPCRAA